MTTQTLEALLAKAAPAAAFASLTRTEIFALQLRVLGGLKTPEIAQAMSWTQGEVQASLRKVQHLAERA